MSSDCLLNSENSNALVRNFLLSCFADPSYHNPSPSASSLLDNFISPRDPLSCSSFPPCFFTLGQHVQLQANRSDVLICYMCFSFASCFLFFFFKTDIDNCSDNTSGAACNQVAKTQTFHALSQVVYFYHWQLFLHLRGLIDFSAPFSPSPPQQHRTSPSKHCCSIISLL